MPQIRSESLNIEYLLSPDLMLDCVVTIMNVGLYKRLVFSMHHKQNNCNIKEKKIGDMVRKHEACGVKMPVSQI